MRLTSGIVCATLTPMDDHGEPCIDLLVDHCRRLLDAGCSGTLLFGTTGEANSFTVAERKTVLERVIGGGIPSSSLIVGCGCCAVGDTTALITHALSVGVARVLVLPPFYYKQVGDDGVIDAYARTIEAVADDRMRMYFYKIPQFSGVDISPAVVDALIARYPANVAGIKDSSGDWAGTAQLCARFGAAIDVLVGSERFLLAGLAAGASGCVTATANAYAELICKLFARRDEPIAAALQERVTAARALFEGYPVIAALKEFETRRSGDARWRNLRPPLTPLATSDAEAFATRISGELLHAPR
jgi:4-hydroxy-tetrahydrodipicolinate synthase